MEEDSKLGVALVKELCPVCATQQSGPIIMNKLLTKKMAKEVQSYHNKVIGFAEKPCEKCTEYTKKGIIAIGIDKKKSHDMDNPYRSGHFSVITDEAFKRLYEQDKVPKGRVFFSDYKDGLKIGIFKDK